METKERNQHPFTFSFFSHSNSEKTSNGTKPKKAETKSDSKSNTKLKSTDNVAATSAICSNNLKVSATTNNKSTIPATSSKNGSDQTVNLPNTFHVKYLGKRHARGLWGIKYTRQPVDEMAAAYRASLPNMSRPILKLEVSLEGIMVSAMPQNRNPNIEAKKFPISSISYCVQDIVYDRIFAIIAVQDSTTGLQQHPFECHAFLCDKQESARDLSLSLATVFQLSNRNDVKQDLPTETDDSEV
ncbi:low density lipoprotein receptor adapter protein 1-A-like [Limulus polyphemus]|uniref:Low density lipoprotein receptor adapter protein 1-A-like n=1 Tax=Limulus polyphemus TaxID=6850 RepID=A0ABM1SD16_LIMPO|nr:low density lipoprotein receptor adapter protein 1-A-like [Limulus polyphemus]